MVVKRETFVFYGEDGTSEEDLAIFLAGWRQYQAWAVREEPEAYDARLLPLIARLDEHLSVLQGFEAMPREEFVAYGIRAENCQYRLFLALIAAIDSTKWLAGKVQARERPRSFVDAFEVLVREGALPAGKRPVYLGMARLRNWIAHEAVVLPPDKAHALLRFYLPELEDYAFLLRQRRV